MQGLGEPQRNVVRCRPVPVAALAEITSVAAQLVRLLLRPLGGPSHANPANADRKNSVGNVATACPQLTDELHVLPQPSDAQVVDGLPSSLPDSAGARPRRENDGTSTVSRCSASSVVDPPSEYPQMQMHVMDPSLKVPWHIESIINRSDSTL